MTRREKAAIAQHFEKIQGVADQLRQTAEQLRKGELNQWRGANRLLKVTDQLAKQEQR